MAQCVCVCVFVCCRTIFQFLLCLPTFHHSRVACAHHLQSSLEKRASRKSFSAYRGGCGGAGLECYLEFLIFQHDSLVWSTEKRKEWGAWNVKLWKSTAHVWEDGNVLLLRRKHRDGKRNVDIMKAATYRANILLFHIIKNVSGWFSQQEQSFMSEGKARERENAMRESSDDLCENIAKREGMYELTCKCSRLEVARMLCSRLIYGKGKVFFVRKFVRQLKSIVLCAANLFVLRRRELRRASETTGLLNILKLSRWLMGS